LLRQRNDNLRLDSAVLDSVDDVVLDFAVGPPGGLHETRIGDADIAVVINGLVRNGNEVTGTNAGFGRDEQTARRRFEDGDADHVADAENQISRLLLLVREGTGKSARLIMA